MVFFVPRFCLQNIYIYISIYCGYQKISSSVLVIEAVREKLSHYHSDPLTTTRGSTEMLTASNDTPPEAPEYRPFTMIP